MDPNNEHDIFAQGDSATAVLEPETTEIENETIQDDIIEDTFNPPDMEEWSAKSTPVQKTNYSKVLVAYHNRSDRIVEKYRTLRTSLLAQNKSGRISYMVTSPQAGEGKTVTALNLAFTLAECRDKRTIVVDGDLRKKGISSLLKIKQSPGFSDLLEGTAQLDDIVQPTSCGNLFVIPAGSVSSDEASGLLTNPELAQLIEHLKREYDFLLFDTPPVNDVSDASILGQVLGDALMVVKMNATHQNSVEQAINLLKSVNVNIAGVVLTHYKPHVPKLLNKYFC